MGSDGQLILIVCEPFRHQLPSDVEAKKNKPATAKSGQLQGV